ncbi:MAG TPA: DNA-binding protein WhiA [Gaiellaceae bacterium]|nr:DNA-binding protein WhiA [Gaiellaceae bacterium]
MPLSDDLRGELAAIDPARSCDRLAELSALFHSAGSLHLLGGGRVAVHLDLAGSAVARRAFRLLRSFGVGSEIRTYRRRAFDRATRYQLHVAGDEPAVRLLREAGVLGGRGGPLERPPKRVVRRACCRGAYLRGALLGGGSLSGPRSPHLEARTTSLEGARFLAEVVAVDGVELKVLERASHAAAYAKAIEQVAGALALAGASDTALAFEERAVVGETRAGANRLANADHANLVRASRAAHVQVVALRALREDGVLGDLPPPLREIGELRLRFPSATLRELAGRCKPPASKAAAHRRLARLVRMAGD